MSNRARVVVIDYLAEPLDHERAILGDLADVVALNATRPDQLIGQIEQADAVMAFHVVGLSAEAIARLQRCQVIVRCGVGYDNVDLEAAAARGIPVANIPDYGAEEVADSALGMLLSLARGIHRLDTRCRAGLGEWSYTATRPLHRLRGQRLGIVGLGRIGMATAVRAKAFGLRVQFYDPYQPDGLDKALGIERAESLDELLAESFAVSLHCPLTPETRGMIDAKALARLPAGGFLVNTARGGIVKLDAVYEALRSGHLAGAALDVLPEEPPSPEEPLIVAWRDLSDPISSRVLITPHIAFYCEEGLIDMRTKGSHNVRRVLLGHPPRNVVNGVRPRDH